MLRCSSRTVSASSTTRTRLRTGCADSGTRPAARRRQRVASTGPGGSDPVGRAPGELTPSGSTLAPATAGTLGSSAAEALEHHVALADQAGRSVKACRCTESESTTIGPPDPPVRLPKVRRGSRRARTTGPPGRPPRPPGAPRRAPSRTGGRPGTGRRGGTAARTRCPPAPHEQATQHGQGDRDDHAELRTVTRLRAHLDAAPGRLHVGPYDVEADAAARDVGDEARGGQAGPERQRRDVVVAQPVSADPLPGGLVADTTRDPRRARRR